MWVCAREEQYGEPNEARYGEADDEGPAPSESRGATIRSLAEKRLQPKRYRRVCEEHKGRCRSWPELEQEWLDHDLTRAPSKLDCRTNGGDRNQGPQWRGALFHLLQHSGGVAVLQRRHGSQRCHGSQGTPQHAVQPAVGRSEGSVTSRTAVFTCYSPCNSERVTTSKDWTTSIYGGLGIASINRDIVDRQLV